MDCAHSFVGYISGVCCIRCGLIATDPGTIAGLLRTATSKGSHAHHDTV